MGKDLVMDGMHESKRNRRMVNVTGMRREKEREKRD